MCCYKFSFSFSFHKFSHFTLFKIHFLLLIVYFVVCGMVCDIKTHPKSSFTLKGRSMTPVDFTFCDTWVKVQNFKNPELSKSKS